MSNTVKVKGIGQFKLPENRLFEIFGRNVVILDTSKKGPLNGYALADSLDTAEHYSNEAKSAKAVATLLTNNGAKLVI